MLEETEVHIRVRVAETPRDRARELNSHAFLKALREGPPTGERAFRDLANHMRSPLVRYISRWIREREAIEDVLQETLLAAHQGLPRFEGRSRLTTWVYSLAYNKAMDRLAEKYRTGRGKEEEILPDGLLEAPDPRPDEAAHRAGLVRRIRSAAANIPELYRETWRLRDLEEMSAEEVGESLGIMPSLVRVRLHRARTLIAARLRKESPGLFGEEGPLSLPGAGPRAGSGKRPWPGPGREPPGGCRVRDPRRASI